MLNLAYCVVRSFLFLQHLESLQVVSGCFTMIPSALNLGRQEQQLGSLQSRDVQSQDVGVVWLQVCGVFCCCSGGHHCTGAWLGSPREGVCSGWLLSS